MAQATWHLGGKNFASRQTGFYTNIEARGAGLTLSVDRRSWGCHALGGGGPVRPRACAACEIVSINCLDRAWTVCTPMGELMLQRSATAVLGGGGGGFFRGHTHAGLPGWMLAQYSHSIRTVFTQYSHSIHYSIHYSIHL